MNKQAQIKEQIYKIFLKYPQIFSLEIIVFLEFNKCRCVLEGINQKSIIKENKLYYTDFLEFTSLKEENLNDIEDFFLQIYLESKFFNQKLFQKTKPEIDPAIEEFSLIRTISRKDMLGDRVAYNKKTLKLKLKKL